jgi:hypothetical protein
MVEEYDVSIHNDLSRFSGGERRLIRSPEAALHSYEQRSDACGWEWRQRVAG